jgi:hypothetical protein
MATIYRNAGIEAAKLAGQSREMDSVALRLAALARAQGVEPVRVRNVPGPRGVRDRVVESLDPLEVPKEFGHVIRNRKDGPVLGYVRGLHRMQKAWKAMRGVKP